MIYASRSDYPLCHVMIRDWLESQFAINLLHTNANSQSEDRGILGDLDTSDVGIPLCIIGYLLWRYWPFAQYYKFKPADIYSIENFTPKHRRGRDPLVEESLVRVNGKSDIYMFRRYIGNDAPAVGLFSIYHATVMISRFHCRHFWGNSRSFLHSSMFFVSPVPICSASLGTQIFCKYLGYATRS